jgi:hypothetical protein
MLFRYLYEICPTVAILSKSGGIRDITDEFVLFQIENDK